MQKSRQFSILIKYKDSEISFTLFNFFANPKHHSVERGFQKLIVEFFSSLCTHKFINFHFGKGRFKNFSMIAFFLLLRPKIPIFHHIFFLEGFLSPLDLLWQLDLFSLPNFNPKRHIPHFLQFLEKYFLSWLTAVLKLSAKCENFKIFNGLEKFIFTLDIKTSDINFFKL